jgi:hypothetical protein
MSSLSIPASRVQQVEAVLRDFVDTFSKPLDTPAALEKFLATYRPDVEWFDHAFLMRRIGHNAMVGLHKSFNHCNQPFRSEIKVSTLSSSMQRLPALSTVCCVTDALRLFTQPYQAESSSKSGTADVATTSFGLTARSQSKRTGRTLSCVYGDRDR